MENSGMKIPGDDRCDNLRWKGLFIDTIQDPGMASGDGLFWCHTTQTCLGPDGKLADNGECAPSRPCFKAL
jgi:hypothetical protein